MDTVAGDYTCSLWVYVLCMLLLEIVASCTTDSVAGDLYLPSVAMCTMDSAAVYTLWIFGRLYLQSVAEDVQSSKHSHIDH